MICSALAFRLVQIKTSSRNFGFGSRVFFHIPGTRRLAVDQTERRANLRLAQRAQSAAARLWLGRNPRAQGLHENDLEQPRDQRGRTGAWVPRFERQHLLNVGKHALAIHDIHPYIFAIRQQIPSR